MKTNAIDIVIALADGAAFRFDAATGAPLILRRAYAVQREALADALSSARVKRGSRVLVLSSDFFSQVVRLPRRQVAGLPDDDLRAALLYEIEPFSNIPRDQGVSGFQALTGESADTLAWRVLQVSAADYAALESVARAAGARLAGCAPLDSVPADESAWAETARRAADAVSATPPATALAAPADASSRRHSLPRVAAALFAVCAVACAAHFAIASATRARLGADVAERSRLAAENESIVSRTRDAEQRRAAIEREAAERAADDARFRAFRFAWSSLLAELPAACGDDVLLRSLSGSLAGGATVDALATGADAPDACMVRLAERVADDGWRLTPRELRATGSGPSAFRFSLEFVGKDREGGEE